MKKHFGIFMSIVLLVTMVTMPSYADGTFLLKEGFEDETAFAQNWTVTDGFASITDTLVHTGTKALQTAKAQGNVTLTDTTSNKRGVVEMWVYQPADGNNSSSKLRAKFKLANSDGSLWSTWGYINANALYQIAQTAASTKKESTLAGTLTKGWHQIVIDMTAANHSTYYKTYFYAYVDGVQVDSMKMQHGFGTGEIPVFSIMNDRPVSEIGQSTYIDDVNFYASYNDVPLHRSQAVTSILFASGKEVENGSQVTPQDGDITLTFANPMAAMDESNVELYERAADSTTHADFTKVEISSVTADETTLSFGPALKAGKEYKLVLKNLTTAEGKTLAEDYVTFTTAEVFPFSEKFEEDDLSTNWDVSANNNFAVLSRDVYHTGRQSLKTAKTGTILFDQAVSSGVYEIWYYEVNPDCYTNTALIHLSDGTGTNQKYEFGMKKNTYNGSLVAITGNGETASVASIGTGWHQILVDAKSSAITMDIYVDGEKKLTQTSRMTNNANISKLKIYSSWDSYGDPIYWDDLALHPSLAEAPVYPWKKISSITFADGESAVGAKEVDPSNQSITLSFTEGVKDLTADSISVLVRSNQSETEADFQAVTDAALEKKAEDTYTLTIPDMQPASEYRVVLQGIQTEAGTTLADDYFLFTTAEKAAAQVTLDYDSALGSLSIEGYDASSSNTVSVPCDTEVTVNAVAKEGYELSKVEVIKGSDVIGSYTNSSFCITLTEDVTLKAYFTEKKVTPSVAIANVQTGTYQPEGSATVYPAFVTFVSLTLPENAQCESYGIKLGQRADGEFIPLAAQAMTADGKFGIRGFGDAIQSGTTIYGKAYVKFSGEQELETEAAEITLE